MVTDLILFFAYAERALWMWIKLAATAFLTVNAFVFLVPMMPELLALAKASVLAGELGKAFHALEGKEQLVGMSNVIPLVTEMVMGAFRPAFTRPGPGVTVRKRAGVRRS